MVFMMSSDRMEWLSSISHWMQRFTPLDIIINEQNWLDDELYGRTFSQIPNENTLIICYNKQKCKYIPFRK